MMFGSTKKEKATVVPEEEIKKYRVKSVRRDRNKSEGWKESAHDLYIGRNILLTTFGS